MKGFHLLVAVASSAIGFAGAAAMSAETAPAKDALRAPTAPLVPLTQTDLTRTGGSRCTCAFRAGDQFLVQTSAQELMIRTRAGPRTCDTGQALVAVFSGVRASATCGNVRLELRRTGRPVTAIDIRSSSTPAELTVTQGRARREIQGDWGCAC